MLKRGPEGTKVPKESPVLRMWFRPKDWPRETGAGAFVSAFSLSSRSTIATAFALSTEDRKNHSPYLSVFESSLTTVKQAYKITGENKPLALRLQVDDIRELESTDGTNYLDVQWFTAWIEINGRRRPNSLEGSEGHAGIVGLDKPSRAERKRYRVKLADLALAHGPSPVAE